MSEYNGTYEFVFFHDQKKGEIIVIMNGQKHVFDDGVSKAVKAERERIIKLLEGLNCPANGIEHDCANDLTGYTPNDLIKLIKGEQK